MRSYYAKHIITHNGHDSGFSMLKINQCYMSVFHLDFTSASLIQKPGNRPEEVDLCGAAVGWTKEKSSRKHVIQVSKEDFIKDHKPNKTYKHSVDN